MAQEIRKIPSDFLLRPVLLIEDEALIGMLHEKLLEDLGFSSITIAVNGEQALKASEAIDFGMIVSDIVLERSKLNGIDAVVSLTRRNPAPTVFITAHAGVADLQRIKAETPRAAILRKPVTTRELNNAIAALIASWDPATKQGIRSA